MIHWQSAITNFSPFPAPPILHLQSRLGWLDWKRRGGGGLPSYKLSNKRGRRRRRREKKEPKTEIDLVGAGFNMCQFRLILEASKMIA